MLAAPHVDACTRVLYETEDGNFIVGRTMDWYDDIGSDLWAFPQGMSRDGGVGDNSITWTSKYGSVVVDAYDFASTDGMNEAGLVANLLDHYRTVAEAVAALQNEPFAIIAPRIAMSEPAGISMLRPG